MSTHVCSIESDVERKEWISLSPMDGIEGLRDLSGFKNPIIILHRQRTNDMRERERVYQL